MGIQPNRSKGTEKVTTLGVMFRITMTSDGLDGTSLEDMVDEFRVEQWLGFLYVMLLLGASAFRA